MAFTNYPPYQTDDEEEPQDEQQQPSENEPSQDEEQPPPKRINASPRNNIYAPGTGQGTGRTAVRMGTTNRDGSTSPVDAMGAATGPLSQPLPRMNPSPAPTYSPGQQNQQTGNDNSSNNNITGGLPSRPGRINAAPRNNIYAPGTGPGTGRTAVRMGTINRDGSTSPVDAMGAATGPLSQPLPRMQASPAPTYSPGQQQNQQTGNDNNNITGGLPSRPGRINAAPRNNIYAPGTGPGTGRTAVRMGTINRDGSTSPVGALGAATGPLSQPTSRWMTPRPPPAQAFAQRQSHVDQAKANGTFDAAREKFNAANPGHSMDESGNITQRGAAAGASTPLFFKARQPGGTASTTTAKTPAAPAWAAAAAAHAKRAPAADAGEGHNDQAPDKGGLQNLVYRTQGRPSPPSQFQTLAAAPQRPGQTKVTPIQPATPGKSNPLAPSLPRKDALKPGTGSGPSPSQPGSNNNTKEAPQKQKPNPAPAPPAQGNTSSSSTTGSQNKQSNMTINDDKNSPFAATVRSAMDREMKDSPASAALLKAAKELPNKIKIVPKIAGEANTTLQADGTIVISVNTRNMTSATMSHELSHAIQQATYHNTLKELAQKGEDPKKKETIDKAVQAGRDALNQVLPLQNKRDQGQEFKENEAMRAGHIVNAERTAAEIKTKIGDTSSMSPDEIAEMLWKEQLKKEDSMHINNRMIIPKGTKYGGYDYAPVLNSLGNGVTREHLEKARKKLLPSGW